ncbi:MAG: hypothetical protein MIO87_02630 [Methanomassiliicoccales archaeon]|nr:hypothetical protein [Methanomassiliicoccales archaeon]TFG57487.1 MAG: hypothetical protein E4H30_00160 [Methanomassiliicoccus sp.]
MPDIRDKVEDDRGLLKKIQLVIPGFRGYRIREDLRDSDRMLRAELAKRLGLQRTQLEEARGALVRNDPMSDALEEIGGVINLFKKVEGEMAHAEVGYSGISADIKIKDRELDSLYEYDASMIESLQFIDQALIQVPEMITSGNDNDLMFAIDTVRYRVTGLEERFKRRKTAITGTGL